MIADHISVRSLEQMVKTYNEPEEEAEESPNKSTNIKTPKKKPTNSEEVGLLTNRFRSLFGTKVTMTLNEQGKGRINIPFDSNDQLEHILALLDRL